MFDFLDSGDGRKIKRGVVIGVIVTAVTGVLYTAYQWAIGLAGQLGKATSSLPFPVVLIVLLCAAYGIVIAVSKLYDSYKPKRVRLGASLATIPEFTPLGSNELEIDLRSIPRLTIMRTTPPEFYLYLRLTNHSKYNLTVTHLNATVSFSQARVEVAARELLTIEPHSTRDDIQLHRLLDDAETRQVILSNLNHEQPGPIYIDVSLSGVDYGEEFTRGKHFELNNFESKSVLH